MLGRLASIDSHCNKKLMRNKGKKIIIPILVVATYMYIFRALSIDSSTYQNKNV